eukprot:GGOE01053730.1.p1 GENE.GGOE01053730.1~~GGOE01053730.1.p1  ORF type:complete len:740 (+),score=58.64 GGOE01053730.1:61-2280(+)
MNDEEQVYIALFLRVADFGTLLLISFEILSVCFSLSDGVPWGACRWWTVFWIDILRSVGYIWPLLCNAGALRSWHAADFVFSFPILTVSLFHRLFRLSSLAAQTVVLGAWSMFLPLLLQGEVPTRPGPSGLVRLALQIYNEMREEVCASEASEMCAGEASARTFLACVEQGAVWDFRMAPQPTPVSLWRLFQEPLKMEIPRPNEVDADSELESGPSELFESESLVSHQQQVQQQQQQQQQQQENGELIRLGRSIPDESNEEPEFEAETVEGITPLEEAKEDGAEECGVRGIYSPSPGRARPPRTNRQIRFAEECKSEPEQSTTLDVATAKEDPPLSLGNHAASEAEVPLAVPPLQITEQPLTMPESVVAGESPRRCVTPSSPATGPNLVVFPPNALRDFTARPISPEVLVDCRINSPRQAVYDPYPRRLDSSSSLAHGSQATQQPPTPRSPIPSPRLSPRRTTLTVEPVRRPSDHFPSPTPQERNPRVWLSRSPDPAVRSRLFITPPSSTAHPHSITPRGASPSHQPTVARQFNRVVSPYDRTRSTGSPSHSRVHSTFSSSSCGRAFSTSSPTTSRRELLTGSPPARRPGSPSARSSSSTPTFRSHRANSASSRATPPLNPAGGLRTTSPRAPAKPRLVPEPIEMRRTFSRSLEVSTRKVGTTSPTASQRRPPTVPVGPAGSTPKKCSGAVPEVSGPRVTLSPPTPPTKVCRLSPSMAVSRASPAGFSSPCALHPEDPD